MTLGVTPRQADLFRSTAALCEGRVAADSIYGILHRECFGLFPDEMFADLFMDVGRRSVPPMIVAVVMVLQRIEGCSDREAADRFAFDARWKYAAGGLDFDYPGFAHTVLVDMRARLARSGRPDRIFEVTLEAAWQASLVGRRRVLDSTPLYDAVATMDTVTLVRSAIRGLLKAAGGELAGELRGVLCRDDDYAAAGKPACDWDDEAARKALVDALARDARALLGVLDGREPGAAVAQAAALLAAVTGQDLEEGPGGVFRIARRVAPDRVMSTVDPQARHGHKTPPAGSTATRATSRSTRTRRSSPPPGSLPATAATPRPPPGCSLTCCPAARPPPRVRRAGGTDADRVATARRPSTATPPTARASSSGGWTTPASATASSASPRPQSPGYFPKDRFAVDLETGTVTCPAGVTAPIRASGHKRHAGAARFGASCRACPLAGQCTKSSHGRTITIGPHEARLAAARTRQQNPAWKADYRATRPKVERKIGHLMRRRHGGRRARVRGQPKVAADFALLAAAVNLARLAVLGLARHGGTWTVPAS